MPPETPVNSAVVRSIVRARGIRRWSTSREPDPMNNTVVRVWIDGIPG